MFPELSLCVNGQESEYPFNVKAYESGYSKIDESGNIYESGKISSSKNLVLKWELWIQKLLNRRVLSCKRYTLESGYFIRLRTFQFAIEQNWRIE